VNYLQNFAQYFAVPAGSATLVCKLTKRGCLGFPFQDLPINSHHYGSEYQIEIIMITNEKCYMIWCCISLFILYSSIVFSFVLLQIFCF